MVVVVVVVFLLKMDPLTSRVKYNTLFALLLSLIYVAISLILFAILFIFIYVMYAFTQMMCLYHMTGAFPSV